MRRSQVAHLIRYSFDRGQLLRMGGGYSPWGSAWAADTPASRVTSCHVVPLTGLESGKRRSVKSSQIIAHPGAARREAVDVVGARGRRLAAAAAASRHVQHHVLPAELHLMLPRGLLMLLLQRVIVAPDRRTDAVLRVFRLVVRRLHRGLVC